jgi:hypothetical protein
MMMQINSAGFDGGFGHVDEEELNALGDDIMGEDEGDMMMLGQDEEDEVEVVTSHVVPSPFNTSKPEERKTSKVKEDEEEGRALNLIVYDQQKGFHVSEEAREMLS